MLFAAEINYDGSDVDTIVRRFAGVGDDEFPEGVRWKVEMNPKHQELFERVAGLANRSIRWAE